MRKLVARLKHFARATWRLLFLGVSPHVDRRLEELEAGGGKLVIWDSQKKS